MLMKIYWEKKDAPTIGWKLDGNPLMSMLRNVRPGRCYATIDAPFGFSLEEGYKVIAEYGAKIGVRICSYGALTPAERVAFKSVFARFKAERWNCQRFQEELGTNGIELPRFHDVVRSIVLGTPNYHECHEGSGIYHRDNMVCHKGNWIERSIYTRYYKPCSVCGERDNRHLVIRGTEGRSVLKCLACAGDVFRCDKCGMTDEKNLAVTVDCDKTWCAECAEGAAHFCKTCRGHVTKCLCANERIFSHSFKPAPRWRAAVNEKEPRHYIGLEIEIERPSNDHLGVSDIGYYKRDGSIGDHGENAAEFVSHPFTMAYYREQGRDILAKMLSAHAKAGGRSYQTDTCGTHIHISRSILSGDVHLNKLLEFGHRNPELFLLLSRRRKKNLLERWANSKMPLSRAFVVKNKGGVQKYHAINTLPRNTIEFRIFRGTLDIEGIDLYLQTVFSMIEYTRNAGFGDLSEASYLDYIRKSRKEYPKLVEFLAVKGKLPALIDHVECKRAVVKKGDEMVVLKKYTPVPAKSSLQEI